jgi:uncharacterized protein (TIGR02996 family)
VSSDISLKDQSLWVSNQRLSTLIAFALQVGEETARSDDERSWVAKLMRFADEAWPGIGFDLEERFPTAGEKTFWARVFHDIGRRIYLRQLGNQADTFWHSSAIGDAYATARMLTRAVLEDEAAWHTETENTREAGSGVVDDEEGFLLAIAADPTDDTARLVYADWLEERGDPRADYLRLVTLAEAQVRDRLPLEDLRPALRDACAAATAEWRGRVGPWYDVVLEAVPGGHKIGVIKAVRNLTHRELNDVAKLVDFLPSVIRGRLPLDEAEEALEQLERAYGVSPWPGHLGPACQVALRISNLTGEPAAAPESRLAT